MKQLFNPTFKFLPKSYYRGETHLIAIKRSKEEYDDYSKREREERVDDGRARAEYAGAQEYIIHVVQHNPRTPAVG